MELAEILEDSPVWTQNMKVRVLLLAVPGIGPTKADRALTSCQIPHSKTVAGLSGRLDRARKPPCSPCSAADASSHES